MQLIRSEFEPSSRTVVLNEQATLEILRKEAEAIVRSDDQQPPDSDQKPQTESNKNRANKQRD